jgi:hypothetical protein
LYLESYLSSGGRRDNSKLKTQKLRRSCEPTGLANQTPQVKPLEQLGAGPPAEDPVEVLAKLDSRRSTLLFLHFGQCTPFALAPILCRREKVLPHSAHLYS